MQDSNQPSQLPTLQSLTKRPRTTQVRHRSNSRYSCFAAENLLRKCNPMVKVPKVHSLYRLFASSADLDCSGVRMVAVTA